MNILYHHRTQGTGAEGVHIAYVIKGLRQLEHQVFVVSPTGHDPEKTAGNNPFGKRKTLKSRFLNMLSRSLPQFLFELLELSYNVMAGLKLKNILKREKIDFIYERNAFFLFAGVKAARERGIPIIVEVNEIAGHERVRKQTFVGWAKRIERYVFQNADAIIVVSEFLKQQIVGLGVAAQKIHVIPNAVDETIFSPEAVKGDVRARYVTNKNAVVIGFIGWFVGWHHLELLIDVFGRICREENVILVLIGDGELKEKLQMMVKYKGINDKVIFPGAVPYHRIPEQIKAMDICVIPDSNEYRSPIKMFEYMVMGKPVVAPRYQPITSVLEHGVDSMLFTPHDEKSFEDALRQLLGDPLKRQQIGQAGRKKILASHTWLKNAERVIAILEQGRN